MNYENWVTGIVIVVVFILLASYCGDTGGGPPRFFGDSR